MPSLTTSPQMYVCMHRGTVLERWDGGRCLVSGTAVLSLVRFYSGNHWLYSPARYRTLRQIAGSVPPSINPTSTISLPSSRKIIRLSWADRYYPTHSTFITAEIALDQPDQSIATRMPSRQFRVCLSMRGVNCWPEFFVASK